MDNMYHDIYELYKSQKLFLKKNAHVKMSFKDFVFYKRLLEFSTEIEASIPSLQASYLDEAVNNGR